MNGPNDITVELLFRWGSAWIGAHWSPKNQRLCINLIPFVTICITFPYGNPPGETY